MHKFTACREVVYCMICQDMWPGSSSTTTSAWSSSLSTSSNTMSGIISDHCVCARCGFTCHNGCKTLAKILANNGIYTCGASHSETTDTLSPLNFAIHIDPSIRDHFRKSFASFVSGESTIHTDVSVTHDACYRAIRRALNIGGNFTVSLLHAYDLELEKGAGVYGLLLSGEKSTNTTTAQTEVCSYGAEDVVFKNGHLPERLLRIRHQETNLTSLRGVHSLEVSVELWSSITLVNFLDNKLATCSLSLLPLMLYPGTVFERWFPVQQSNTASRGMVLLRLGFQPDIVSSVSTSIKEVIPVPVALKEAAERSAIGERDNVQSILVPTHEPILLDTEPEHLTDKQAAVAGEAAIESHRSLGTLDLTRPIDLDSLGLWAKQALLRSLHMAPRDATATTAGVEKQRKSDSAPNVGAVYVHVVSASRMDARESDLAVVVAIADLELRTHTVSGSATPTYNTRFSLSAPHYRSEICFTLVDTRSDKRLGRASMTVYGIQERDASRGLHWSAAPAEELPLLDMSGGKHVIGYVTAQLLFEEDVDGLFLASDPRPVPPAPADTVSVDRLKDHIARFGKLFRLYRSAQVTYREVTQWEDPMVSVVCLTLFVYSCLRLNAEYILCVPVFALIFLLAATYLRRVDGTFQRQYIEGGDTSSSSSSGSGSSVYRPVAYLRIAVCGFRNLLPSQSPALVKISYLPNAPTTPPLSSAAVGSGSGSANDSSFAAATASAEGKIEYLIATVAQGRAAQAVSSSSSSSAAADIAQGLTSLMNSLNILKSDTRKDAILQNFCDPWDRDISYLYPILQTVAHEAADGSDESGPPGTLIPWRDHEGVLKISVHTMSSFSFSSLMEKEATVGYVKIPLKQLVTGSSSSSSNSGSKYKKKERGSDDREGLQEEVDGWHAIHWNSDADNEYVGSAGDTSVVDELLSGVVFGKSNSLSISNGTAPSHGTAAGPATRAEVRVRAQLDLRRVVVKPSPEEREVSEAIRDTLAEAASGASTFSTLWNMRENVQYVQNLLGDVLDAVESFKNVLTWAQPRKTAVIFGLTLLTWIATVLVPGRYLILGAGLYEFLYVFFPQPKVSPMTVRVNNLLESVPNDVDLKRVFATERRAHLEHVESNKKQARNALLLRAVSHCHWKGGVRLKAAMSGWEEVFLVLQGRRVVWFAREDDVSEGREFLGQLLLAGHAGSSHASPMEVRETTAAAAGSEERLCVVFGQDQQGLPLKVTLLCGSVQERDALRALVDEICSK